MQDTGYLNHCRYVLHDRDKKFCLEFRETLMISQLLGSVMIPLFTRGHIRPAKGVHLGQLHLPWSWRALSVGRRFDPAPRYSHEWKTSPRVPRNVGRRGDFSWWDRCIVGRRSP